jgi:hypothetical protein
VSEIDVKDILDMTDAELADFLRDMEIGLCAHGQDYVDVETIVSWMPGVEEAAYRLDERVKQTTWFERCRELLITIGASTPEDHTWVVEARWLLDNWPGVERE